MAKETKQDDFGEVREHLEAAVQAWRESVASLIPEGFIEKGKEGHKEALLAVRSLLDVAIDKLESEGSSKTKKKVKVEAAE